MKPDNPPKHHARPLPRSILFLCGLNVIRSPIAEVLARNMLPAGVFVCSAGIRRGDRDPFVDIVLNEIGVSLGERQPQTLDELHDSYFDLIVTLAPEAHHAALELTGSVAIDVEYWPTADPTTATGTREQIIAAYRDVRDRLAAKLKSRFDIQN